MVDGFTLQFEEQWRYLPDYSRLNFNRESHLIQLAHDSPRSAHEMTSNDCRDGRVLIGRILHRIREDLPNWVNEAHVVWLVLQARGVFAGKRVISGHTNA